MLIAANGTAETSKLVKKIIHSKKWQKYFQESKIRNPNTTNLVRLALYNLITNPPPSWRDIEDKRIILIIPEEFDDFLKEELRDMESEIIA